MEFNVPGLDRGVLVAAFAGAVAYLCTREKMPLVRATACVVAGTVCAVYVGPGTVEHLDTMGYTTLGEKARYGVVFLTGVSGIWLINILISVLDSVQRRSSKLVNGVLDRVFNQKEGGK